MAIFPEQARDLLKRHGPTAPVAILGGAVAIGLVALVFAHMADWAGERFTMLAARWWWAPLVVTPTGYAAIAWTTARFAPAARGSGIPQVMATTRDPDNAMGALVSARTVIVKLTLTICTLLVGASTGREGPTAQVAASIMGYAHRWMAIPLRASVFIGGGAAGVAAAFNAPLAGVAFAIEELAAAYEQRMTLLVMTAVLIAGMVSLGLLEDYVYFGVMRQTLSLRETLIAAPVAGILGGLMGAFFSRAVIATGRTSARPAAWLRARPARFAGLLGIVVAVIGVASGLTWGTGYGAARGIITGADVPHWFGVAKLTTTLATAVWGMPGGIFAPSLAVVAGIGDMLRWVFSVRRFARSGSRDADGQRARAALDSQLYLNLYFRLEYNASWPMLSPWCDPGRAKRYSMPLRLRSESPVSSVVRWMRSRGAPASLAPRSTITSNLKTRSQSASLSDFDRLAMLSFSSNRLPTPIR